MGGDGGGCHLGGGPGGASPPEQMVCSANNGWGPGSWGLQSFGGRGGVVMSGTDGLGTCELCLELRFVPNVISLEVFVAKEFHDQISHLECYF